MGNSSEDGVNFDISDDYLSGIICKATLHLAGIAEDYVSIDKLSDVLFEQARARFKDRGKYNYKGARVLLGTLQKFSDREIESVEDLSMKTSLFARELRDSDKLDKERKELLKRCCLEIYYQILFFDELGRGDLVA